MAADRAAQLEACRATVTDCRALLQTATDKDEAFKLAILVAEHLMKAIKLSSSPDEKKQFKAQCHEIMDVATRIKNHPDWRPEGGAPQPARTKHEQIGQWAAEVAVEGSLPESVSASGFEDISSYSGTTAPVDNVSAASGKLSLASFNIATTSERAYESRPHETRIAMRDTSALLIDLSDDHPAPSDLKTMGPTDAQHKASPKAGSTNVAAPHVLSVTVDKVLSLEPELRQSQRRAAKGDSGPTTPSMASSSKIRRLAEPVSTRKRSNKEEIILLKASLVNGFKCPPWDKNPSAAEFVAQKGAELFTDTHDLSLSSYQQQFFQGWARAGQAIPPSSTFSGDRSGITPLMSSSRTIDLVQDAASDCSVVTSLCAGLARAERGHDQMLTNKLYPFDKQLGRPVLSTNGKYIVRLNFNGCWRRVVIDDRLPVSNTHRLLHVIDRHNSALLWPALLEKAYLKVRGGYDFPGSNSCSDLFTLTGWIPEQVFLQETSTIPDQLWDRIYKAFMFGDVLVTTGTGRMSHRQERELGLEGQHSYVVLDMKETDDDRLLLVKNPWVEGKGWTGSRPSAMALPDLFTCSGSSNMESYHRDSMPTEDRPHPTTFWIGLEQVIQHFESLYLNWNPGLFGYRQDIHFDWNIDAQQTPGACIITHPQFAFSAKGPGPVWFLLSRHFRDAPTKDDSDAFNDGSVRPDLQADSSGEHPKGYMSVYICNGQGERLYMKETYLESSDYVTTPQCLLRWDVVQAGDTYTVVIDQDELPHSLYTFTLSAYGNSPITLEHATQRYPLQKIEEGSWKKQSSGGSTSSVKYFENPQYSLEVCEPGASLAILLSGSDHEHPLHVKLALGYGKRIYKLQSRDVLADSGDHRSGCVFAEIKDLQPGLYTIICSLFEAGQLGDYSLRIDSTSKIIVKPIARDGAGLLSMKLSPACFGSQVHKIAAPLVPHRLAAYTIVARFWKAMSPRSADLGLLARSPLRFSVELGRGPDRKFVIASERGEYSDSAIVRSESVNIDPTLTSLGDMYLVLDRLSGPGGPVEEWYEVEIFTDAQKAFSVGVWRTWDD